VHISRQWDTRFVDEKFIVLDMKDPTPREEELLQL
jgi:hypothetical protein